MDATVWIDACFQVFVSYGVSMAMAVTLGSFNKDDATCFRDSILVCVLNSLTSIFAGFAVFAFIGFIAHETNQTVDEVTTTGPGLAFLVYPKGTFYIIFSTLYRKNRNFGPQSLSLETTENYIIFLGLSMMLGWSKQFWSAAFFLMLASIGIGTQINQLLALTTAINDNFPIPDKHKGLVRKLFSIILDSVVLGILVKMTF